MLEIEQIQDEAKLMIGFLCFALAAGILVGFSTEQLDTSGRPHGVGADPGSRGNDKDDPFYWIKQCKQQLGQAVVSLKHSNTGRVLKLLGISTKIVERILQHNDRTKLLTGVRKALRPECRAASILLKQLRINVDVPNYESVFNFLSNAIYFLAKSVEDENEKVTGDIHLFEMGMFGIMSAEDFLSKARKLCNATVRNL
ncbi:hypothetical protein Q1695_004505 [Nippostrongylus brasiliensis]|nr:hypothetical protein Q1695_004505 [Nippostrongylus brasiliensis]